MRARGFIAAAGAAISVAGFAALTQAPPAVAVAPTVPGAFVAVTPANLLDTGTGVGAPAKPLAAHGSVTFQVAGRGGVPSTGVGSVSLTVAVVAPAASGFATVYPADVARPGAASLDFTAQQTIANLTIVGLGTTGTNAGKVTIYNGSGAAVRMVANVSGYYLAGTATDAGAFTSVTPANLLDTGAGIGAPATPVAAGTSVTFQVAGRGGVPATGAGSAALVVAAVTPSAPGFATVYAADIARPPAAALDFVPRQTIANLTVSGLSADGKVSIYNGSGAALRLVANVVGYFAAGSPVAGGTFSSLAPANLLDTGTGVGAPTAPVAAHGSVTVQVAGRGGVPYTAGSVALTVAAVGPASSGFATIYPADVARPGAAALDFTANQTIANLAVVGLSATGKVTLFNGSSSPVRLVVNVSGFWLNGPDTVSTGSVSDLVASGDTSTSVRLFWHNPTDRDFAGVKICHRTDTPAPPTCTSIAPNLVLAATYTETGLTPSTQYSYEVFAVDAAGNVAPGVSTSGTTQPASGATTGTISGTVRDSATQTQHPVSNVLVHVYPQNNSALPALQAVTASDGTYSINVPGGNYRICFDGQYGTGGISLTGYQDRCFANIPWPRPDLGAPINATSIHVATGGANPGIDGVMYPAAQIGGTVTEFATGAVVANVHVLAFPVDDPSSATAEAVTQTDGTYLLRNVTPLAHGYYVCFDASAAVGGYSSTGYADQCYKGIAWDGTSTPTGTVATIGAPGRLPGINAALAAMAP
jgi:hypothetical protein